MWVHNNLYTCTCMYLQGMTHKVYGLTLSTLGKIFSRRHYEIFLVFSPENRIWYFMQIVSNGDNLHEMSNPVFWER